MDKTLKISDKTAREIYPGADAAIKRLLEETFGKDCFSQKITDRIKTFDDACYAVGMAPHDCDFTNLTLDEIGYKKAKIIVKALNEGWTPDWNNSSEGKYYPWFKMATGSGSSFACVVYGLVFTTSGVGSRLVFKSRELAEYAGKQFLEIYKQFML